MTVAQLTNRLMLVREKDLPVYVYVVTGQPYEVVRVQIELASDPTEEEPLPRRLTLY